MKKESDSDVIEVKTETKKENIQQKIRENNDPVVRIFKPDMKIDEKLVVKKTLGVRPLNNDFVNKTLAELNLDLQNIKKTFSTVNLESLPDKGKKLIERYRNIKNEIQKKHQQNEFFDKFKDLTIDEKNIKTNIDKNIDKEYEDKDVIIINDEKEIITNRIINDYHIQIPENVKNRLDKWSNIKPQNSNKFLDDTFEKTFETIKKNENKIISYENIKTTLMEHQISAVKWMLARESSNTSGGILADEMGLGKTLTILALIAQNLELSTLVITPLSVLHQWENEIRTHTINIYHFICHGKSCFYSSQLKRARVVLTTYGSILSANSTDIQNRQWDRIVLDEAHSIKNNKTKIFKTIRSLRAEYRWALTGTPIHNSLNDFHSLVQFLNFEPWCEKSFWKMHIEKSLLSKQNLSKLLQIILLRRTKSEKNKNGEYIIKLPNKKEILHKIHLNSSEQTIYNQINKKLKDEIRKFFIKNQMFTGNNLYSKVLVSLVRLQQASSHLFLLKHVINPDEIQASINDIEGLTLMFDKLLTESNNYNEFSNDFKSAKIRKLLEILNDVKNTENPFKFVIVSQWTSFLKIIEFHIIKNGFTCDTLSGSVKADDRQDIVDKFNKESNPQILLLSLKAGGVGLNLIGANHLILMDQHWNPALESQACDRIHRVGQLRNVTIHKMFIEDSIEDHIYQLKNKKLKMVSDIFQSYQTSHKLTFNEMKYLLNIENFEIDNNSIK